MLDFTAIHKRAIARKGGEIALQNLLPSPLSSAELIAIGDDRYLSAAVKCIQQAGFHWGVIDKKWPQFEEAFLGFDIEKLAFFSDEQWENYMLDARVVRNWQKIQAVKLNVFFFRELIAQHGGIGQFITTWPHDDQFGVQQYLKKHGNRLGGMTAMYFLRRMGVDSYILSGDVCLALRHAGLDIQPQPTAQRELKLIQTTLNEWHQSTGLPYAHISKILAYSVGENYDTELIQAQMGLYG